MKGKRTIILGIGIAILGVCATVPSTDWIELVGPQTAGIIISGLGVAVTVLRFFTNTPPLQS